MPHPVFVQSAVSVLLSRDQKDPSKGIITYFTAMVSRPQTFTTKTNLTVTVHARLYYGPVIVLYTRIFHPGI